MSKRSEVDNFHSTKGIKKTDGRKKIPGCYCWSEKKKKIYIYIYIALVLDNKHNITTTQSQHSLILLGSK